jgi:hypothetical protein
MAYSDFTLSKVKAAFQLTVDEKQNLFAGVAGIKPTDFLQTALKEFVPLAKAIGTEKARSKFIIADFAIKYNQLLTKRAGL